MKTPEILVVVAGCIGITVWCSLFGMGLFIDSQPYRTALGKEADWNLFWTSLLTYTPTNIAALCVFAAFCGGCSKYLLSARKQIIKNGENEKTSLEKIIHFASPQNPFTAMLRGFVVYMGFLAGTYIGSSSPFANTTPEQYARAAGAVSLLSFVIGFDQGMFKKFIGTAKKAHE